MAKKDKKDASAEATQVQDEAKKVAKEPKPEKVWFLGEKPAASETVFGAIKGIIHRKQDVANGVGVSTGDIVKEMMATFQPKKTAKFGESYIKAYVRDLEKFGYGTTDPAKAVTTLTEAPVKAKKEGAKKGKVSAAGQKILNAMKEMSGATDYQDGVGGATSESLATKLSMKPTAVAKAVESLVNANLAVLQESADAVYINFTKEGWDAAQAAA